MVKSGIKKTTPYQTPPSLSSNGQSLNKLNKYAYRITRFIGTPKSIIIHSLIFAGIFLLALLDVSLGTIMLVLTTAVSLEAIYLSLLIQMSVNRNTESLEEVEEELEDLQEDVEEISEDIEDIQEEDKKDDAEDRKTKEALNNIEEDIDRLLIDLQTLKKNIPNSTNKKYLNG